MIKKQQITGVVLAGGKASRMGFRDKAFAILDDAPLIEHVIANSAEQVGQLIISVNRNLKKFEYLELPLISDIKHAYSGPLVGICSAMHWMLSRGVKPDSAYLACFPADVPWFPHSLVEKLKQELEDKDKQVAWSECAGQVQPLFSLWSLKTLPIVEQAIENGLFGPKPIMSTVENVLVKFEKTDRRHFLNINTKEALQIAKSFIES